MANNNDTHTRNKSPLAWDIIDHYFRANPNNLVDHHLASYNDFIHKGIYNVFKENGRIDFSSRIVDPNISAVAAAAAEAASKLPPKNAFTMYLGGREGNRIYFGKPIIYDANHAHFMYPNDARLRNMNYGTTIHFDVDVDFTTYDLTTSPPTPTHQSITLDKIYLGRFPIMLQSSLCILHGMDRNVRYQMGECLNDFGGYFIIDGKEKVIVSQETFADNMLYIRAAKTGDETDPYLCSAEIRSRSEDTSKPIRTTAVRLVAPNGTYANRQIVVSVPNVRKPVPLFILMRALGVISDEDIIRHCLLDLDRNAALVDLFIPSVHDAGTIFTQESAIAYITSFTKRGTDAGVIDILSNYLLPHIGEFNAPTKAYFVGYMVHKMLKVVTHQELPTDRDNYQYKRVDLAGTLLTNLFREYFLLFRNVVYRNADKEYYFHVGQYENNIVSLIEGNVGRLFLEQSEDKRRSVRVVEEGFRRAFKGAWGSQANTQKEGVMQDLNRLSWNTFISHLRKLNVPIDSTSKVVGPRLLNPSQWGYIDPIDTPDGASIGLQKHMALGCRVTSGFPAAGLITWLRNTPAMGLRWLCECSTEYLARATKVIVNGAWIGAMENILEVEWLLKLYRRNGVLPVTLSISFNYEQNELRLCTDSGRLIRPIYYVMQSNTALYATSAKASASASATAPRTSITMRSYDRVKVREAFRANTITWPQIVAGFGTKPDGFTIDASALYPVATTGDAAATYEDLVKNAAVIDYIDTAEEESALIAFSAPEDVGPNAAQTAAYTHIEIEPSLMLGVMGNQIIFPENNPLTRNAFSCGQSKQAVSLYSTNYAVRMDKMGVVLNYGQIPLVKSRYLQYLNQEQQPYGVNAVVAIMCYTAYNVEDAVLINEGALQRNLFRTTYFTTYTSREESSKVTGQQSSRFANIEANQVIGLQPGCDYSKLDPHGLIREGEAVNDETVLIGKLGLNPDNKDLWIDASETPKKGQLGFVDKAFMTENEEGFNLAKVRVYEQRMPAIGDKFASRSGQKGTIGLIVPERDMPFTAAGIRPDIIINPHAIPSRMTVGQIIESVLGKTCAYYGAFGDCTAFQSRGINYNAYKPHLLRAGYSYTGCEIMYNGMTGEQIAADVYLGPTYYMRLKHMVKDKINYRALGPREQLTRQPVHGRAHDGGLRIGEMERDGILAHGMSAFLQDSLMTRGDEYMLAVCNKTGTVAIYNPTRNLFLSPFADGPIEFTTTSAADVLSTLIPQRPQQQSTQNANMSVKCLSKFGRSFSVVRVPFAFKLLLQELQAMNVQMRVVTDENVGQLGNLAYSYNVDRLLTSKIGPMDEPFPAAMEVDAVKAQITATLQQVHADITRGLARRLGQVPVAAAAASVAQMPQTRPPQSYLEAQEESRAETPTTPTGSPTYAPGQFAAESPPTPPSSYGESPPMAPDESPPTSPQQEAQQQSIVMNSVNVSPGMSPQLSSTNSTNSASTGGGDGNLDDDGFRIVKEATPVAANAPPIPDVLAMPNEPTTSATKTADNDAADGDSSSTKNSDKKVISFDV